MRKNLLMFTLGGVIGIFTLNFVLNVNNITEDAIKELQYKNDSLLKANTLIDSLNLDLYDKIETENNNIYILKQKDLELNNTINELNTKLKTLNKKYEKAYNYSNNFNSNEISIYFSNLR